MLKRSILLSLATLLALACGESANRTPTGLAPSDLDPKGPSFSVSGTEGAIIATDRNDYAPGETVNITGTGWAAGEAIHLKITEDPAVDGAHESDVNADQDGNFADASFTPGTQHLGVTFTLTATGAESGTTAQLTFTDNAHDLLATVSPTNSAPGAVQAYTFTITNCNVTKCGTLNGNQIYEDIGSAAIKVPTGFTAVTTVGTPSASSGKPWVATYDGTASLIKLTSSDGSGLAPGQVLSVQVKATAPAPATQTSYTWDALAHTNSNYSFSPTNLGNFDVDDGTTQPSVTVAAAPSVAATVLAVKPVNGIYGDKVDLEATLTVAATSAPVVGVPIAFKLNGNAVGSANTNTSGVAKLAGVVLSSDGKTSGTLLPAATYTADAETGAGVEASFAGVANTFALASDMDDLTIVKATAATTIKSVSPSSVVFGEKVTVGVEVAPQFLGTPSGTVVVKDGTTTLCTVNPLVSGAGSCSFFAGDVKSFGLTAGYNGDANFKISSSGATALVVGAAPTTTAISSVTSGAVYGQKVVVGFSVDPSNIGANYNYGSVTPSGTVAIKAGSTTLCSASVGAGSCSFFTGAVTTLSLGAEYTADSDSKFEGSSASSTTSLVVSKAPTTTTASVSAGPYIINGKITVTNSVVPQNADDNVSFDYPSLPSGNVTIALTKLGSVSPLGTCTASVGGSCEITLSEVGKFTVSASYPSDANFGVSNTATATSVQATYQFDGLYAPVDKIPTMNTAKAGQAIPLKWRLTDATGQPILNLSLVNVAVSGLNCAVTATLDDIEQYAGSSGLQNLGDGYYQFNWKTPTNYASTCRSIGLDLGEGSVRGPLAYFQFKK